MHTTDAWPGRLDHMRAVDWQSLGSDDGASEEDGSPVGPLQAGRHIRRLARRMMRAPRSQGPVGPRRTPSKWRNNPPSSGHTLHCLSALCGPGAAQAFRYRLFAQVKLHVRSELRHLTALLRRMDDLWVDAPAIGWIHLPPRFARLRHSPHGSLTQGYPEAMSADIVLTSHVRSPLAKPGKRASDLRFYFVAGAGFEPATSGL